MVKEQIISEKVTAGSTVVKTWSKAMTLVRGIKKLVKKYNLLDSEVNVDEQVMITGITIIDHRQPFYQYKPTGYKVSWSYVVPETRVKIGDMQ